MGADVLATFFYLFYVVNIMGDDVLAMQGARASATMIFIMLNQINLVPTCRGLRICSIITKCLFGPLALQELVHFSTKRRLLLLGRINEFHNSIIDSTFLHLLGLFITWLMLCEWYFIDVILIGEVHIRLDD